MLKAAKAKPIDYPKPVENLTFDRLSSVFVAGVSHEEDQPPHLKVLDMALQKSSDSRAVAWQSVKSGKVSGFSKRRRLSGAPLPSTP
jgi:electron-transferring-flavoprotein dehydrogenase